VGPIVASQVVAVLILAMAADARAQAPPFVAHPYFSPIVARVPGQEVASMGDLDADGVTDFVVADRALEQVVVYDGRATFQFDGYPVVAGSATPLAVISAPNLGEAFGWEVQPAGDVNGDGAVDLIVGAPFAPSPGKAYLFLQNGPLNGTSWTGAITLTLPTTSPERGFGWCVASAGDVDNDGLADVIVGAPANVTGSPGGGTHGDGALFFGCHLTTGATIPSLMFSSYVPAPGTPDPIGTPAPSRTNSGFGTVVMDLGDTNLDGFADVIIGAPATTHAGRASCGAAWVFTFEPAAPGWSGGASVVPKLLRVHVGLVAGEYLGYDAAPAGYFNADAFPDYVVGALGIDLGNTTAGSACGAAGGPWGHADVYSVAPPPTPQLLMRESVSYHLSRFAAYVSGDPDHDGDPHDSDFDGDGFADVLVSDYRRVNSTGTLGAGAYFVYSSTSVSPPVVSVIPGAFSFGMTPSVEGDIACGFLSEATAILPMAEPPGAVWTDDAPRTAVANGPNIEVGAFAGGVVVTDGDAVARPTTPPGPRVRYLSPAPSTAASWLYGVVEVVPASATHTTVVLLSLELAYDPAAPHFSPVVVNGFPVYPSTNPLHVLAVAFFSATSSYQIPTPLSAAFYGTPSLTGLHSYLQVAEFDPARPMNLLSTSDLLILRLGV
jgi:hypothetical protein